MVEYSKDKKHAFFDGIMFCMDEKTGYYRNSKTHKRLHVCLWEHFNGAIPKGYHVHHKDFNKTNNSLDNLELLPAGEHISMHQKLWDSERMEKQLSMLKEKAVPKANEWHKSADGKEWHKMHYLQTRSKMNQEKEFVCMNCGKTFKAVSRGNNKFCSNKCKTAFRNKSGVDDEIRKCEICGNEFTTNKYSKAKTCSRECSRKLRWNKIHPQGGERTCLQFGS